MKCFIAVWLDSSDRLGVADTLDAEGETLMVSEIHTISDAGYLRIENTSR